MGITREDVMAVAALARLRLSDEEIGLFATQLTDILAHMDVLAEVDGDPDAGEAVATDWDAPLREDEPGADRLAVPPEALAPAWVDGFFTVPRLAALDATALDEPFADKAAAVESEAGDA